LTTGFGIKRPIRIWFQIQQKLFAADKNGDQKMVVRKKKNFFKHLFKQEGISFLNFFYLFLV
jgi:hypothetical protein